MDLSKFTKAVAKSVDGLNASMGFRDPKTWIHTGNYALNYRVSGDFKKGFPLEGKMTLLAGSSGSAKSLLLSGNAVKWCQDNDVLPFLIDTENAIDESWLKRFDIDLNKLIKVSAAKLPDIAKIMSDFLKTYKDSEDDKPYEERQKVLFIIDSLGMTITETEETHFEGGTLKGDLGLKQKQIFSICRNFISACGSEPIGLACTQHTYASQDMFNPDAKVSGGSGVEFTPSIVMVLEKRKLKEDENGNKTATVRGVKVDATVRKTRYTQPFQKITFTIPWDTGMDAYSGLFELFSESLTDSYDKPILQKSGTQYVYVNPNTQEEVFKKFRKAITNEDYDQMMADYMEYEKKVQDNEKAALLGETPEEIVEEPKKKGKKGE